MIYTITYESQKLCMIHATHRTGFHNLHPMFDSRFYYVDIYVFIIKGWDSKSFRIWLLSSIYCGLVTDLYPTGAVPGHSNMVA